MDTGNDTLIVPPALQAQVKAAAAEGDRNPADDVHAKIAEGLESLRQGKGLDGESVMAELIAELDDQGHPGAT